ncbi:MAG: MgtC/SapB family protein [Elusimicrobia bacterium]|nr:MgtC/SapB family protein [Elusimicrobiota bacterium]
MESFSADAFRLLVSMALGVAVGIERELMEKPAGVKTNVLICMGSTAFTLLSLRMVGPGIDPTRIAAQILSGIGFLGAGAIMREGDHVTGLTTAATIWVDAAIGMAVGMGYFTLACLAALATLIVQVGLNRVDMIVDTLRQRHIYRIVSAADRESIDAVVKIMRSHRISVMYRKIMKKEQRYHSQWWTYGHPGEQEKVLRDLLQSDRVIEVTY